MSDCGGHEQRGSQMYNIFLYFVSECIEEIEIFNTEIITKIIAEDKGNRVL